MPQVLGDASPRCSRSSPAPAIEFAGRWRTWGELATPSSPWPRSFRSRARASACCCAIGPPGRLLLGALRAGACVVAIDPQRGAERVRREIASLELPTSPASRRISRPGRAGGRIDDALRARRRWGRRGACARRVDRSPDAPRRRRADADERNDGTAEARRPLLRDALARPGRREALRVQSRRRASTARRRRGRQLAARPPRRSVPRPAVRRGRPLVRAPRALHGGRLGRRRPPPSSGDGEPRACGAPDGPRGRRRSART